MTIIIVCIVYHVNVKCIIVYVMTAIVYLRGISFYPMVWSFIILSPSPSHSFSQCIFHLVHEYGLFWSNWFIHIRVWGNHRQSIFPMMAKRCYILLLLLCAWCTDCSPSLLQVNFSALSIYVFRMHASCVGVCLFDLSCLNVFLSIDCLDLTLNVVYDIDSLSTTFVFV